MKLYLLSLIILVLIYFYFPLNKSVTIKERFYTSGTDKALNVDSLVVYHKNDIHWLIATAKISNELLIYDANDGKLIKKIKKDYSRPNGISLIQDKDLLIIVERDAHQGRIIKLPEFEDLFIFGTNDLVRPYGIDFYEKEKDLYHIFITDNYMNPENKKIFPKEEEFNKRVKLYEFNLKQVKLVKTFGDIKGQGILKKVETILIDPKYNRALIADEHENNIKIYSLNGTFEKVVLKEIFKSEPEGFALFKCNEENGYYFLTDQFKEKSIFHIVDRKSLVPVTSFKGDFTANTDGVSLTQKSFGQFQNGSFYAVHTDGGISSFSIQDIFEKLNLFC